MLPETLLCLLVASLAAAQSRPRLLNGISSFNTRSLPQSASFSIPPPSNQLALLSISIALCSESSSFPRFFVSGEGNDDSIVNPGPNSGQAVSEIVLRDGQGSLTELFPNGGILGIDTSGLSASGVNFDIGISTDGPIHVTLDDLPLLGDTSSNQAIIFSAPFLQIDIPAPKYPNYTLPSANMTQPPQPAPTQIANQTLAFAQTSSGLGLLNNKPRTGCFISSQVGPGGLQEGTISSESLWVRDDSGWRTQWVVEGLTPSTNYTAYVLTGGTNVSGPIFLTTKSASFPCPLVHSLPYCPSVAYAVPLPAPPATSIPNMYDSTNLPSTLSTPIVSYLANFTTVLTTFACGRDWYSPLMECDDCQREYRAWLCSTFFTRCGEPPSTVNSAAVPAAQVTDALQQPLSALVPQFASTPPRNPFLSSSPPNADGSPSALQYPYEFTALLPCIEQCHRVDRACPPFVGIKCPSIAFNAATSYGVGFIDGVGKNGGQRGKGKGATGVDQDQWGNVWCGLMP